MILTTFRSLLSAVAATSLLSMIPLQVSAQESRPLRLVVDYAPGGIPDVMARIIGQKLSETTGRPVVVENRPGAGGRLAINYVAAAPADGTVLMMGQTGSYAIAPHLMNEPSPFGKTLKPVSLLATAPIVLAVNAAERIDSIPSLVARARATPGMPYGSSGNGSAHHLAMELLKSSARIDLTHVPYKGASLAAGAVTAGEVKLAFLGLNTAVPLAKSGSIRILGVASSERSALAPEIPTLAEAGVPGYGLSVTLGFFVQSNVPQSVVNALNASLENVLRDEGTRAKLASMGVDVDRRNVSPDQYSAIIRAEYEAIGQIVKTAKLKTD